MGANLQFYHDMSNNNVVDDSKKTSLIE